MIVQNIGKLFGVVAIALVIAGCGGGSGGGSTTTAPAVDNSILASGQNAYGYYGKDVILGNTVMWGVWNMTATFDGAEHSVDLVFYSDGRFFTTGDYAYGDYGVSLNGQVLQNSVGDYATITNSLGNDCYTLSINNNGDVLNNANFCKTASLNTIHTIMIMHNASKAVCDMSSPGSGQSNYVAKTYPNSITCADFDTSNSICSEASVGIDNSTACVVEADSEVTDVVYTDTMPADDQKMASDNFFGVDSFQ